MHSKVMYLMLIAIVCTVDSYKLLLVFTLYGKSSSMLGHAYVKFLLSKGHEITYITPFPMDSSSSNLRQIDVSSINPIGDTVNISSFLLGSNIYSDPYYLGKFFVEMWDATLNHESVQNLLMNADENYDAVIADWFGSDLYSGFAAVYKCPMIWASSTDFYWHVLQLVDETPNPAYIADITSPYYPPLDLWQRARELWLSVTLNLQQMFQVKPLEREAYVKRFGPAIKARNRKIPDFDEVASDVALVLANTHPASGSRVKIPQNVKCIGGYHIDLPPPALPKDLQDIMDSSEQGVIYFSLGSHVKSKDMPYQMKIDILNVLGSLKETVLWKYENDDLKDVPNNVVIRKWMPQHGILAHPKTKLFITHGGQLSTTETITFGIPAVAVPLLVDQFPNVHRLAKAGMAVTVNLSMKLASELKAAINEILKNPRYTEQAKKISTVFADRLVPPGEELVYWVEHVVRTGGAHHLRSPAKTMPFYQKIFLDLFGAMLVFILAIKLLFTKCMKRLKDNNNTLIGKKKQ